MYCLYEDICSSVGDECSGCEYRDDGLYEEHNIEEYYNNLKEAWQDYLDLMNDY